MPSIQQVLTWIVIAILILVFIVVVFSLLDIFEAKAAAAAIVALGRGWAP